MKKPKTTIEIAESAPPSSPVTAPVTTSRTAQYALESQRYHEAFQREDMGIISKYHLQLGPDRKRLETALAQFNAIAPEAKKLLRDIESHKWAGGHVPGGNLAEEMVKLRGYLFGGVGFTKAVDAQIRDLLSRVDNFTAEVRLWQQSSQRPLERICEETAREIHSRVGGITPICGRSIRQAMAIIEEKYPPMAEADKERWRQKLGRNLDETTTVKDLPASGSNNIVYETSLKHD